MSLVTSVTSASASATLTAASWTVTNGVLPTPLTCGGATVETWKGTGGVEIWPVNNVTWPYVTKCCKTLPILIQQGFVTCTAYCDLGRIVTKNETKELVNCYKSNGQNLPGIEYAGWAGGSYDPESTTSSSSTASATASPTTKANSSTRPRSMGKTEIVITSMMLVSVLAGMML
ncbi:hypothetical protein AMS68_007389 [Peltaster fructicola]|uniref:Uncharacterized protein n=1 Tax=Peltaster fructicola TaxID=286661 RepID=A0A6H0Y4B9_9PEZI|nr:hypothetical protein AMS68_007389 [Peltaster fructicola]